MYTVCVVVALLGLVAAMRASATAASAGCCVAVRDNERAAEAYGVRADAGQAHRLRRLGLPRRGGRLPAHHVNQQYTETPFTAAQSLASSPRRSSAASGRCPAP